MMLKQRAALALILALTSRSAVSQTVTPSSTTSEIGNRILSLAVDSSRAEPLARALFDSLGPRMTGTPDLKRANDWLVSTYKSWGIDARNENYGTWRGWRRGYSHIDMISPRVRSLEGLMLGYSPGTGKRDLTAKTIILPRFADSTAFVKWLPNAKGKFVLVSGARPTCRPPDDWAANATPASRARADSLSDSVSREWTSRNVRGTGYNLAIGTGDLGLRMEKAGIAGMITSRPKRGWGTFEVFETYNTRAPAVVLGCEDYGLVYRLTETANPPTIRMNLDAELLGEQPVFNTIATIKGTEKPDEYVVLSAHFDSWDGSSGATDNGTGTIMVMEAMRILKRVLPNPKRTIIAGHWSGEEEGENGSRAFTEDHPEVIKGLQALFNQDNGTGRIVRISGAGLPDAARHMSAWVQALPDELRVQAVYQGPGRPAGGGSDDFAFSCYGTPAFGLGALNWNYGDYTWHTNRDTYDKVVFDDLKGNAAIAATLAYMASEDPTFVTRERVDLAAIAANPARRGGASTTWPECQKAHRTTSPRLR